MKVIKNLMLFVIFIIMLVFLQRESLQLLNPFCDAAVAKSIVIYKHQRNGEKYFFEKKCDDAQYSNDVQYSRSSDLTTYIRE
jgi:hypothetical protein